MADLNKLMAEVQSDCSEAERLLRNLLVKYESLYNEGNKQFIQERVLANGSMDGMEDFRHLVLTVKRNKDIIGSLVRGIDNLRSIKEFKFIEEEIPVSKSVKPKKRKTKPKKSYLDSIMPDVIDSEGSIIEPMESIESENLIEE